MKQESHVQWAIYCTNNFDYYISLNRDTLEKIKDWNIVKSKIVILADKEIKEHVQKKLFITLLTDEERKNELKETKFIHTPDKIWLKISDRLLNILMEENPEDYEHRYNTMWDKIHFLIKDEENLNSEKSCFDNVFKLYEKQNKKLPEQLDIFESGYYHI